MIMWSKSQLKILPITYLIITALIIILVKLLKNKNPRIKTIPLAVISAVMIIGEIAKISLSIITKQFTAWQIPLHYCSMLMPWFFLSSVFTEKSRDIFYGLSLSMGIPAVTAFLIFPNSMLRNSTDFLFKTADFYHYHNFLYHIFIVLFVTLLMSLKLYKPKIKDLKFVLIYFYIWALTAAIFSNILNESYANLLRGDFEILETIRLKCGYFIYLLFLCAAGYAAIAGTFLMILHIKNYSERKKEKYAGNCKKVL